jgi:hypothetical protein
VQRGAEETPLLVDWGFVSVGRNEQDELLGVSRMKAIHVIITLFAFLSCAQGAESLGWEKLFNHSNSQKELRAAPTITVQRINKTRVYLRVENRTGIDIEYSGYSKEAPRIFTKEKRDGKWVATSWNWCATDMKQHVLKNQETTTFEIEETRSPIQIFTIFYNAKDHEEFSVIKLYDKDDG